MLKKLEKDKRSSLFGLFVSDEAKIFVKSTSGGSEERNRGV
jgi:hypothetical protein